jgi:hypothetical protein
MTIKDQFTTALSMSSFVSPSGQMPNTMNLSNTINTRQMRNKDWGAVAYLATSNYGRGTSEVYKNNSSSFYTGCAGAKVDASYVTGCANQYYTTGGQNASTTNNVYGIYDMSGGAYEYTLSNYNNTTYSSGFTTADFSNYAHYLDIYLDDPQFTGALTGSNPYERSNNFDQCTYSICGGQALHESLSVQSVSSNDQSWLSNYSNFVISSYPWAFRGGYYVYASGAGLWSSDYSTGTSSTNYGFRAVLSGF